MAYTPKPSTLTHIDVTPLVNVSLILLIVFMVVTPMIREGIEVNLPPAAHGEDSSQAVDDQLTVSIDAEGVFYVDLKAVSRANLEREIAQAYRGREAHPIVVKGDGVLQYGDVLYVMHACRRVGASEIDLLAKKSAP